VGCKCGSGEAGDGSQDLVCRFGPAKGLRLLVMSGDELSDRVLQFLNASVRAALDLSLCEQCEPPGRFSRLKICNSEAKRSQSKDWK